AAASRATPTGHDAGHPVKRPSVAVILVTRDRPALLADALASIAAQTVTPLEVRIADDGEAPVAEVVESSGLLEVTLLRVNLGNAGAARNRAASGARSDVLAFLDDDDRWRPHHLAGLIDAFLDSGCDIAYRDTVVIRERIDAGGRRVAIESRSIERDWEPEVMAENDYLPPSALGVRRSLFASLGGFDESFAYSEDWDFLMRGARVS